MNGVISIREMTEEEIFELVDEIRDELQGSESVCMEFKIKMRLIIKEMNRRARINAQRCHTQYIPLKSEQVFE